MLFSFHYVVCSVFESSVAMHQQINFRCQSCTLRLNYDLTNVHWLGCRKPGALEGIPVAFKDNFCTKNVATTCGSRMLWNFRPSYDATMVTRMMANGTVTIGKTNMDEFAMG